MAITQFSPGETKSVTATEEYFFNQQGGFVLPIDADWFIVRDDQPVEGLLSHPGDTRGFFVSRVLNVLTITVPPSAEDSTLEHRAFSRISGTHYYMVRFRVNLPPPAPQLAASPFLVSNVGIIRVFVD